MNTASHGGWLARLERLGNRLPPPTLSFVGLCLLMLPLSAFLAVTAVAAIPPVRALSVPCRSLPAALTPTARFRFKKNWPC